MLPKIYFLNNILPPSPTFIYLSIGEGGGGGFKISNMLINAAEFFSHGAKYSESTESMFFFFMLALCQMDYYFS
jgi:hypothetical protein